MNKYLITFTTPIIRDNNLKARDMIVEATSQDEAEAIAWGRVQGLQVVSTEALAQRQDADATPHNLTADLESQIAELKRQVAVYRQQRDEFAATAARYEAEAAQATDVRRRRHESTIRVYVHASNTALAEAVLPLAGSPFDRAQGFIALLLSSDAPGSVKTASYLLEGLEALAKDSLGVDLTEY